MHKLHNPEPINAPLVALGVLVFSMLAEGISLWGCMREVNKVRGNRSIIRWFRETRQSDLLVVFGEDSAALIGLSFALLAIMAAWITGNPMWDALGSICIGVLLIFIALFIGIEVKALLIGQAVEPKNRQQMLDFLTSRAEIERVFNLLTLQLGNDVMVAVKVKIAGQQSAEELITAINTCEAAFKKQFPETMWLFFEPDNQD